MSTQPASVVCQIQNNVARITLNRPPLNILDIPMIGELHEALTRVRSASVSSTRRLHPEADQASRESRPRQMPLRGYCGC